MAERANEFMNKWGFALVQAIFLAVLIPWGWKMTEAVNKLSADMQESHAWQSGHIAKSEVESRALKLEISAELQNVVKMAIERSEGKQDQLKADIRDVDRTMRSVEARAATQTESLSTLAAAVSKLQALVTQALVDNDFNRNNSERKGP